MVERYRRIKEKETFLFWKDKSLATSPKFTSENKNTLPNEPYREALLWYMEEKKERKGGEKELSTMKHGISF